MENVPNERKKKNVQNGRTNVTEVAKNEQTNEKKKTE